MGMYIKEKSMIYIGFSTIHGFGHLLGSWQGCPWVSGHGRIVWWFRTGAGQQTTALEPNLGTVYFFK